MEVELLHHTPLEIVSFAIRECYDSHNKSDSSEGCIGDKDFKLIDTVGNVRKHSSVLEHCIIFIKITHISNDHCLFFMNNPFSHITIGSGIALVRTNLRVLIENKNNISDIVYKLKDCSFGYLLTKYKEMGDFPNYRLYDCGVLEKFKKSNKHDSFKRPMPIKHFTNKYGYVEYILQKADGTRSHKSQHRLLMEYFTENVEGKNYVNHIDGDKKNNNLSNLEWVTASENELHSYRVLGKKAYNTGRKLPSGNEYRGTIRPVIQYDLSMNTVKEWFNPTEAETVGGFSKKQISGACLGRQKTHKGYIWRYKDEG